MIPLLFPFIADTVIAPPPDYEDIFVNEWGVVVFTAGGTTITGAPEENGNLYFGREPFGPLLVDAPVVWFHGAFFNEATFTVKTDLAEFTAFYPEPDFVDDEQYSKSVSWNIYAPPPIPLMERPEPPDASGVPFAWAMPFWREVPSRDLYRSDTQEFLGNFLYYEAGMMFFDPPEGIYDPELLAGYYATEGLVISTGPDPVVERIQLIPLPDGTGGRSGTPLSDDEVCQVICDWAAGGLKSQEIEALWQTWEPFFTEQPYSDDECVLVDRISTGTEKWILFPLPWDEVEEISRINLEIHGEFQGTINYNRLFLGLVRVY